MKQKEKNSSKKEWLNSDWVNQKEKVDEISRKLKKI